MPRLGHQREQQRLGVGSLAVGDWLEYNTVRLHASIGYVTPDDEHHGRGPAIRRARAAGLKRARAERIKQNQASKR